jgi:hypothetical protein
LGHADGAHCRRRRLFGSDRSRFTERVQQESRSSSLFRQSPATFVAHTFLFIFAGVTLYVAGDAAFNPEHTDDSQRLKALKEGTYSSYVGSNTAWFEPFVAPALARVAGPAMGASWFGSALLPATLAYTTVKGVGWNDWGNSGLNRCELKMNNFSDK